MSAWEENLLGVTAAKVPSVLRGLRACALPAVWTSPSR